LTFTNWPQKSFKQNTSGNFRFQILVAHGRGSGTQMKLVPFDGSKPSRRIPFTTCS
jgi:hypothetical protein